MLKNDEDPDDRTYFDGVAMPVDVFHFKSKHKESDVYCNTFCNPARWAELVTEHGKWRFNSSAAEQANVWFGRYHPIMHGMGVDRYEFFLDEMIKRRNKLLHEDLRKRGLAPYFIPREDLLCDG